MNINEMSLEQLANILDSNEDYNAIYMNEPVEGIMLADGVQAGLGDIQRRYQELISNENTNTQEVPVDEVDNGVIWDEGGVIAEGMPSPEEQFEQATGIKFDPSIHEIEYNGADDFDDTIGTPFRVIKKRNLDNTGSNSEKENDEEVEYENVAVKENEEFLENETPAMAFERVMGIPFDPSKYYILENDDAYDDGYDNPISTFTILEKRPVMKKEEDKKDDLGYDFEEIEEKPLLVEETKEKTERKQSNIDVSNLTDENGELTKEGKIIKQLEESAARLRDALANNDSNAIASERSYRQSLFAKLNEIKASRLREINQEKIEKLEALLASSAARLKIAEDNNDENNIASERSYRQGLLNEIARLKDEMNVSTEVGVTKTSSTPNQTNQTTDTKQSTPLKLKDDDDNNKSEESDDNKNEETDEKDNTENRQEEKSITDDIDHLSEDEIRNMIRLLEIRKKAIDDKIIKIDLNAPWDNTAELMKTYILISKEINNLKKKLPVEIEDVMEAGEQEEKRKPRKRKMSGIKKGLRNIYYFIKNKFKSKKNTYESDEETEELETVQEQEEDMGTPGMSRAI